MATQVGRGGGGRDVADGKAHAGRSGERDNALGGGRDHPSPGSSAFGQMQKNRQAQIADLARRTGAGTSQIGNSGRTEAGLAKDTLEGMQRDFRDEGNSTVENAGNAVAGLLGFREQRPTAMDALDRVRETASPTSSGVDMRANWGFDVLGALANFAGLATGVPAGTIYNVGRWTGLWDPPTIGLGPDVFGGTGRVVSTQQAGTAQTQGRARADVGRDRGPKMNGLLRGVRDPETGVPATRRPPTVISPSTPSASGLSRLPTPTQKFQAPSYYAGTWEFDPASGQVVWVPKKNGLLAA